MLTDDTWLVAGGHGRLNTPDFNDSAIYDSRTDSFTAFEDLPEPGSLHAMVRIDENHIVYVEDSDFRSQFSGNIWVFDIQAGTWSGDAIANLPSVNILPLII